MNQEFIRNVMGLKGEEGRKWLDNIPHQMEHYIV